MEPRKVIVKTFLSGHKESQITNSAKINIVLHQIYTPKNYNSKSMLKLWQINYLFEFQALYNKRIKENQRYEVDLFKMSNIVRSNSIQLSIAQNTAFPPYNLQNNCNHENHKHGQVALGSHQKGKTISDLKMWIQWEQRTWAPKVWGLWIPFQLRACQQHNCPDIKRDLLPSTTSIHHFSWMEIQLSTMDFERNLNCNSILAGSFESISVTISWGREGIFFFFHGSCENGTNQMNVTARFI